jgi:hypothetical protein
MNISDPLFPTATPRLVGHFVGFQAILWFLATPLLGISVARVAVWVQGFRAPLVLFPLLVGIGLGLLLVAAMRRAQVGHRATVLSGTILAAAVAVAGQHYFSFLDFQAALTAQKPHGIALDDFQGIMPDVSTSFTRFMQRQAMQGRPVTGEYSLRGAIAWASWSFDGLLSLFAVLAIVRMALRTPYCSHCRSWYRTTRAGPISGGRALRAAKVVSLPIEESLDEARYRLAQCISGCGPSRLEIAYRGGGKNGVVESWLSAAQREGILRILEGNRDPGEII